MDELFWNLDINYGFLCFVVMYIYTLYNCFKITYEGKKKI